MTDEEQYRASFVQAERARQKVLAEHDQLLAATRGILSEEEAWTMAMELGEEGHLLSTLQEYMKTEQGARALQCVALLGLMRLLGVEEPMVFDEKESV